MKELLSDGEWLIMLVRVEVGAVMVRPMDCGRSALCITPDGLS
jgi:hypothetical protein